MCECALVGGEIMNSISKVKDRYQTTIPMEIRTKAGIEINSDIVWTYDEVNKIILVMKKPESYTDYILGLGSELWKSVGGSDRIKEDREKEKQRLENIDERLISLHFPT